MRTVRRSALVVLLAAAGVGPAAPPDAGVAALWVTVTAPPKRVVAEAHTGPVVAAQFLPGKTLVTAGGDKAVARWDAATARPLGRVVVRPGPSDYFPSYPGGAAFSADGTRLVAAVRDTAATVYDPATGAELGAVEFPDHQPSGEVRVSLSADGKTVLATFPTRENNSASLAAVVGKVGGGPAVEKLFIGPGRQRWSNTWAAALTPDGSKVVVTRAVRFFRAQRCELLSFAAADGEQLKRVEFGYGNYALTAAAAPGNRAVAVAGPDGQLVMWDAVAGTPRQWLDVTPLGYAPPVFSADGRTVVVLTGTSYDGRTAVRDYRIRVLEAATGGVRFELDPGGYVNALAVSADGGVVAAGLREKSLVLWDVSPAVGPKWWEAAPAEPAALWAALATAPAPKAWHAIRELTARPDVAVKLLREKLKPVPVPVKPAAADVAKLIARLDAPAFVEREAAERALRGLGPLVAGELRAALRETKSAEARERLDWLLDRIDHPHAPTRAESRAVEVLERAGTPAARELLAAYAAGAGHTPLAAEAKAALGRLGGK